MKPIILTLSIYSFAITLATAQELDTNFTMSEDSLIAYVKSIESSLEYETGIIEFETGNAVLTVPAGFRFLDKTQSNYVLTDLWGNPSDESILGLLVPENTGVLDENGWAFSLSFEEMGYVEDDDAEDINYDELAEELRKEFIAANIERAKEGYESIEFIGWASSPYYDKNQNTLHWAKELKFGEDQVNTLNYNLRVLGRKGVFVLNAIASMNQLPEVKQNIDKVITSVEFKEGHKYADFVPETDNVAAWTVGGLVAGKVLAKAGFFAVILKFWKIIAIAFAALGGGLWKFFKRKKNEDQLVISNNTENTDSTENSNNS